MIYYDTVENFKKDCEKYLKKECIFIKDTNEILVDGNSVKYHNINVNSRSFSKPFFIKNQIKLNLIECNENVKKEIELLCLAYTDNEINAIIEKMPIIKRYSESNLEDFNNISIIWRDHFLEDNIGLLLSFVRMGVNPSDVLVLDKGDSTKHRFEITATFRKLGFNVEELDNSSLEEGLLLEKGKQIIDNFLSNRTNQEVVVLDDGAIISKILCNKKYENIKAVVELTEMGLRRISKLNKVEYPILNVAKTNLKKFITYKEISNTIFTRIIDLLGDEKISGRTIIQLGYGDLGITLAKRFRQYGANTVIVDPNIFKLIEASEEGFCTYKSLDSAMNFETPFLIIGASGEYSINRNCVEKLESGSYVTAGATADLSVFKEYEKEGIDYNFIPKYGTQYNINGKNITVLGNGRSVNLFDSESIPNKSIDIFKAATLVAAHNAVLNKLDNGLHLEKVNIWVNDSKILDMYYDMYFSRDK